MEGIALIIALAVITEALVEYAKSIGRALVGSEKKAAVTQLLAIVVSSLLCFAAGADLFQIVGINFSWPWLGTILTGVLGSRGANYLSDLLGKLQKTNE